MAANTATLVSMKPVTLQFIIAQDKIKCTAGVSNALAIIAALGYLPSMAGGYRQWACCINEKQRVPKYKSEKICFYTKAKDNDMMKR